MNGCGYSPTCHSVNPKSVRAVQSLSPDRFRAVLDVLATVTIAPVGKGGGRVFNPQRVQVVWR